VYTGLVAAKAKWNLGLDSHRLAPDLSLFGFMRIPHKTDEKRRGISIWLTRMD
jgi:hypothetical protein